jgi:Ca2+:H+ antiporter
MSTTASGRGMRWLYSWTTLVPVAGGAVLAAGNLSPGSGAITLLAGVALVGTVLAAVHHAEVIAHRVGEPFGTLVLALCVTLIEVALIGSMMLASGPDGAAIARDTVYATVMLVLTGIIGASLLIGGARHREQTFQLDGIAAALSTLAAIAVLTLVFPVYTTTVPGPSLDPGQLVVIALAAVVLYGAFVLTQTVRHRAYFLDGATGGSAHAAAAPTNAAVTVGAVLLLWSLVVVVLLAKTIAPWLERTIEAAGARPARSAC